MKLRLVAFFIGMVTFSMASVAQDSKIGLRASLNLSNWYTGDEVNDQNLKAGFAFGGFYRSYITDFISIQPGIEFSQKGSTFRYNNFFGSGEIRGKLNYIDVPVLVNLHLTDAIHVGAGGYAGFLLSAKSEFVNDNNNSSTTEEFDRDDFTTLDYGLVFDAGIDLKGLGLGLRYNLGLNDVIWDNALEESNLGKNAVIQAYVQIGF
jgi:hypothetical protein